MATKNPHQVGVREATKPPLWIYRTQAPSEQQLRCSCLARGLLYATGLLVSGLTCSRMLLDTEFTALASDVCCPQKQWPDHGDSTIRHQEWRDDRGSLHSIEFHACWIARESRRVPWIQTPGNVMETGGKEKRKRAVTSCLVLPYPSTLELDGCKFF